ncbi:MAG TPA: hypothetical protein DCE28_07525 [Halomonas sp.]|nr:hypothetical protein [Halomonas sp.]
MLCYNLFEITRGRLMSEHTHRHNKEGPCHFSLMSLSAVKRLLFVAVPLLALWALVVWAGGWLG